MLEYLKNKVIDELKDSVEYMRKALETKGEPCSHVFYTLSTQEGNHATELVKCFTAAMKEDKSSDEVRAKMYEEIMDAYVTDMGSLEGLKKLYCK